ncbi:hypothetical protein SAMN05443428_10817 [Caloramator quimbayensis]|uniref:DUF2325 domain-containing protein n=1 Tax=Caloramator quimbayensis TaxID=1147123 RepID=A0A1T4XD21_9CLOT|nr:hypothetical protein [Caloramator quimbayensis]SKA87542.1 hypothetical protein SAMN05443428_10817 [Caloramator quimbayensis]
MTNISHIINSNDYPIIIVSILRNTKVYSLIDEEYNASKTDYDEVILKNKIFKNKRFNMIPESMLNYGIKLTALLLSNNGEYFYDKILQEGWPQLYSYIRDCNKIIYEDVAKIKEYVAESFEMYAFYIVVLLGFLHNKKVSYETNEGRSFAREFYKWRSSIIDDDPVLTEFNTILDESCTRIINQINEEKILEERLIVDKNRNMFNALFGLLETYNISLNDELGEYSASMNLNDEDKELLNIYAISSKYLFDEILDDDVRKREMIDFIISARFLQGMIKKYRVLYKAYIELYKNDLIDWINLSNKIERQEKINEKLISENQQLKEELRKMKEEQNKHEAQEIIKIKRQYESSIQEMAGTIERYKEENEALKAVIEDLLQGNHYANEEQIINDIPKVTKGVIIGGSPQWQQNMKSIVPHYKFIEAHELNYDTKVLENAERIYFNTAYCSHALFYKTINIVRKKKLDILFINNNSVTAGIRIFAQNNNRFTDTSLVS